MRILLKCLDDFLARFQKKNAAVHISIIFIAVFIAVNAPVMKMMSEGGEDLCMS